MSSRRSISKAIETRVLVQSRRRCCLCVFLLRDWNEKPVQIAHINRNPGDGRLENLVALCLVHHDIYDSRPKQSKGITPGELRVYKKRLSKIISKWEANPQEFHKTDPIHSIGHSESFESGPQESELQFSFHSEEDESPEPVEILKKTDNIDKRIRKIGDIDSKAYRKSDRNSLFTVRIGDEDGNAWQIILLEQKNDSWQIITKIFVDQQYGNQPTVKLVPGDFLHALVITQLAARGTGTRCIASAWYLVAPEIQTLLFRYPSDAYVIGWGLPIQWRINAITEIFPTKLTDGAKISVLFEIHYRADPSLEELQEVDLFSVRQRMVLEWDARYELFVPTKDSNITQSEANDFYADGLEQFKAKYRSVIERLRMKGNKKQQKWAEICLRS